MNFSRGTARISGARDLTVDSHKRTNGLRCIRWLSRVVARHWRPRNSVADCLANRARPWKQLAVGVPHANDAHVGVGWASHLDDVRIAWSRVGVGLPVLHSEPTVKRHAALGADADAHLDGLALLVGLGTGLDDGRFNPFEVAFGYRISR